MKEEVRKEEKKRSCRQRVKKQQHLENLSASLHDEDDEEALKWAAIQRLPTYDRLKKGLLLGSQGRTREIDIKNLDFHERHETLERLVKNTKEDNEKFLLKLRNQIDSLITFLDVTKVGIKLPTIEVRFQHLNIDAVAYVGSRALPTVFSYYTNMVESFLSYIHVLPSRKKKIRILRDISGIIKPSRMTLLLGPPSSGKTTLLFALSGMLDQDLGVSGKVTYNGYDMSEFVPQKSAAYISQYDLHIPEMTVRETLAFSARCQGVGSQYDMLMELLRREKASNIKPDPDIDIFMKAADTEGQEMSIIVDYVLKPPPETYDLFDDIILLCDGLIVYQGPRQYVLEFFESLGFECPERKEVANFLQEVISKKDQGQYWARKDEPYKYVTAKEFAEAFMSFHVGLKLRAELHTPFDKSKSHPAALTTKKYGARNKELLKACISRELLLMKRNSFVIKFKLMQLAGLSFVAMTVFLRTEMHRYSIADGGMFMGSLCYFIYQMFNGFSETATVIAKLQVFYKQRALLFYPPWAYALPSWFLRIPLAVIEVAIVVVPTYYVIGYDPNIGRFFRYYLLLLLMKVMVSSLFRLLGAVGRTAIIGNTFGALVLNAIFILGGYTISPGLSKFNKTTWSRCSGGSWNVSIFILVLAIIGFTVLYNCLFAVALTYLKPIEKRESFISEETLKSRQYDDIGAMVELPQQGRSTGGAEPSERGNGIMRQVSSTLILTKTGTNMEALQAQTRRKGMILPFEPHSITFDEIRYFIDMPQEMKEKGVNEKRLELLKGVSGSSRPGVLSSYSSNGG
ncbi:hypothetical protein DITRI_Ditri02bG0098700 [Diplodiscus trichospermus]